MPRLLGRARPSGFRLDYDEVVDDETTTDTSGADFSSPISITVPPISRPVVLKAGCAYVTNTTANKWTGIQIVETTAGAGNALRGFSGHRATAAGVSDIGSVVIEHSLPASNVTRTFKLQKRVEGGTGTIGTFFGAQPAYLKALVE